MRTPKYRPALALVALLGVFGLSCQALGQPTRHSHHALHASSTAASSRAADEVFVKKLGHAMSGQDQILVSVLGQLGFPPPDAPQTWAGWQDWPPQRKLELAYWSAEAARRGSGNALMTKIVRLIAAQHIAAIRYEPDLAHAFTEAAGHKIEETPTKFNFNTPPVADQVEMPPEARRVAELVSRYVDPMPKAYLLSKCCALSEDETFRLTAKSATFADVLRSALTFHPPPPTVREKLARLVGAAHELNPALGHEPGLQLAVQNSARESLSDRDAQERTAQMLADLTKDDPTPSVPSSSSLGLPLQSFDLGGQEYRAFERASYPTVESRAFEVMTVGEGGFGGVVFGAPLISAGVPWPRTVYWISGPQPLAAAVATDSANGTGSEPWGRLGFALSDGRVVTTKLVRADTALAALRIAYSEGRNDRFAAGLVGLVGHFDLPVWTGDSHSIREIEGDGPRGFAYAVNPSIADTMVGRALIELDTLPVLGEEFLPQLEAAGVPRAKLEWLSRFFDADLGWYKWTDTKLEIVVSPGGLITVDRPASNARSASAELRSSSYMTMVTFGPNGARPEIPNSPLDIYPMIPTLSAAAPPFARANEFVEIFALLRWAHTARATWIDAPPPAPALPSANAVAVSTHNGKLQFDFGTSMVVLQSQAIDKFEAEAEHLKANETPSIAQETKDIAAGLRTYIANYSALAYAGNPLRYLFSQYTAKAGLSKSHPEVYRQLVSLRRVRFGAEDPHEWLEKNKAKLIIITPGLAQRITMQKSLDDELSALKDRFDAEKICTRFLGAVEKESCSIKLFSAAFDKKCCATLEGVLPGIVDWYRLLRKYEILLNAGT